MRSLIALGAVVVGLMFAVPAQAQSQKQLNLCNNAGNKSTPEQMVANCSLFIKGKARGPQLGPFYINRGIGYFGLQQYDKAFADIEQGIALVPKNPVGYLQRANVWQARGELDKAIADLTRATELNSKYVYAFYNRGNFYLQKGDFAKADADFTTAIAIDPKLPVLYANRSNVRSSLKRFDEAIDDATRSLALMPKNTGPGVRAISLGNRAVAYGGKKQFDLAIADLDEAIKLAPRPGFYHARGYALSQSGHLDLALKDAEELVRLDANDASAWNLKCWYNALMGRLDAALSDCDKSLSIAPANANTLDSRAFVEFKLKQYDKAIDDYNRALKQQGFTDGGPVGSIHANSLFGRGLSRLRNGDALGGATDMAAAKAAKPEVADDYSKYGI